MRAVMGLASIVALACASVAALSPALAEPTLVGAAAYGDWRADAPGVRRKLSPTEMPAPLATPPAGNSASVIEQPAGAAPKAPPGFTVTPLAKDLAEPRVVRVAPNGDIFVVESAAGRVRVLRADGSGGALAKSEVFAAGLRQPFGVAFYPPGPNPAYVYVATTAEVFRFPYRSGDLHASGPAQAIAALPGGRGHVTRDIAFSPDGSTLFVSVGSASNAGANMPTLAGDALAAFAASHAPGAAWGAEEDRADVLAFNPDGGQKRVFATGLRNCAGLAVQPGTGTLWCVVNERDLMGDDLPPDYATSVKKGGFYGWPWYYIGAHQDRGRKGERPDLADKVATPDVLIQPHSAPLGIAFYDGSQFPAAYKGDAFVALHGSWNRAKRTGYKVVRLLFKNGEPTGEYEDFMVGFVADDANVWGRPVDVAIARDGSLLVTDDAGGVLWRIAYEAE